VVVLSSAFVAGEKQRREAKAKKQKKKQKKKEKKQKLFDKWIEARPRKKMSRQERSQ